VPAASLFAFRPAASSSAPLNSGRHRTRALLLLTLVLWSLNFAIGTLANALASPANLPLLIAARLGLDGLGLGLCVLLYAFRHAFGRSLASRVLLIAALAPLAAAICALGSVLIQQLSAPLADIPPSSADLLRTFTRWAWFFLGWSGLSMALEYYFDARDEELRASELHSLAQRAQLRVLHSQINPHFLFNSLNSVSALIGDNRAKEADHVLDLLATYFRKTLTVDLAEDIPLVDEIQLHAEYLKIEQARYANLNVEIDIDSDVALARIPALLAQPLVENAVKYGAARSFAPSSITVRAFREGDRLVLIVQNSQSPTASPNAARGAGLGLQNVRERLAGRFGEGQNLAITQSPDAFTATITMPLTLS